MERHLTQRLYIDAPLMTGITVTPNKDQAHYLLHVLRLQPDAKLRLFNGHDGEWLGHLATLGKKSVEIAIDEQSRQQSTASNLWLCCALIKKAHFDYMLEKATELGVGTIQPLLTARTQIRELNQERCRAIAIESAEQSERLDLPTIQPPKTLTDFLENPPEDRTLVICAETGEAEALQPALQRLAQQKAGLAIVTGPEGGFTPEEFVAMHRNAANIYVRLGPRILRADTAALAAVAAWQTIGGDWT